MKRLIAAAILLSIIGALYFTGDYIIKKSVNKGYSLVNQCDKSYEKNHNSEIEAKKLKKYWDSKEGILSFFAHHNHIDEVEKAISTLVIYSKTDNYELYSEYSDTVKTLLHQLYEDNSLSMHSIF